MNAPPYAIRYAKLGWHVLPLHWITMNGCSCRKKDCGSPGKHPFQFLAPRGLQDATDDIPTIGGWFHRYPELNIGIRTGEISGIVVVDIDVDKDGLESFAALQSRYDRLEDTIAVMTGGGGLHLYLNHPGHEVRNSASTLGRGIDVRGDGGYVVAPPSLHASGNRYLWDSEGKPGHRPIADMPAWIVARSIPVTSNKTFTQNTITMPGEFAPIPEGQRNSGLASIAGKARRLGADDNQLAEIVERANAQACHPPLPPRETASIIRSIQRYERGA